MSRNPECNSVETNWNSFKEALTNSNSHHNYTKARKDLPWIIHGINRAMKSQKKLYDHSKQCNTEESWHAYQEAHNKVNKMVNQLMNGTVLESWTLQ